MAATLTDVKTALGITGEYQDQKIQLYINTVEEFLKNSGVKEQAIDAGVVAIGVTDLWSYESGEGKFSKTFMMLATQLALRG